MSTANIVQFPSQKKIFIDKYLADSLKWESERRGYTVTEVSPLIREIAEEIFEYFECRNRK